MNSGTAAAATTAQPSGPPPIGPGLQAEQLAHREGMAGPEGEPNSAADERSSPTDHGKRPTNARAGRDERREQEPCPALVAAREERTDEQRQADNRHQQEHGGHERRCQCDQQAQGDQPGPRTVPVGKAGREPGRPVGTGPPRSQGTRRNQSGRPNAPGTGRCTGWARLRRSRWLRAGRVVSRIAVPRNRSRAVRVPAAQGPGRARRSWSNRTRPHR